MKYTTVTIALALVFVALLFAVIRVGTPPSPQGERNETRIVSLTPSVTEMIFAMGLEDRLVGVTNGCDYPPQASEIEAVGGFGTPNLERLLALRPDVVITTGIEREELPAVLEQSGIRFLQIDVGSFERLFASFGRIAEAAGVPSSAHEPVARLRFELQAVAARYDDVPTEHRPTVFAELWHDPMLTAGGSSFLTEVIERAGGVNVAGAIEKDYPTINPEQVLDWNPHFILLGYENEGENGAAEIGNRIGWSKLEAVEKRNIIGDIHPDLLLRPGPRLVQGVRLLADRLWLERRDSAKGASASQ